MCSTFHDIKLVLVQYVYHKCTCTGCRCSVCHMFLWAWAPWCIIRRRVCQHARVWGWLSLVWWIMTRPITWLWCTRPSGQGEGVRRWVAWFLGWWWVLTVIIFHFLFNWNRFPLTVWVNGHFLDIRTAVRNKNKRKEGTLQVCRLWTQCKLLS